MTQLAYDPSNATLLYPEREHSLLSGAPWPDETALAMEMSRLAYVRAEDSDVLRGALDSTLVSAGFKAATLFFDLPTDSYGFATVDGAGLAVLAFRGTQIDHLQDFLTNAQIRLVECPLIGDGRVHQGFLRGARALWPQVNAWLQSLAAPRPRLLICGHSLGGALATLLAHRANADSLTTIGCPMVGDERFADALESRASLRIIRVVNCCDGVPTLPGHFFDYAHVAAAIHIDRHGQRLDAPTYDELREDRKIASAQYPAIFLRDPFGNAALRRLADHAPHNYIRAFWP
ncbi:lipase family protein [Pseudomonas sp. NPDC089534]|uniref:lipase family protein n=1 Tax=Pseudomonas sp. NPDC089534 TaxID=3364468 RepID=UPI003821DA62